MFDIFGLDKAGAKESIREMAHGFSRGLIEAYLYELSEKDREIISLKKELAEQADWRKRYEELSAAIELKKQTEVQKDE